MNKKIKIDKYILSIRYSVIDYTPILTITNKAGLIMNYFLGHRKLEDIRMTFLCYITDHFVIDGLTAIAIINKFVSMGF